MNTTNTTIRTGLLDNTSVKVKVLLGFSAILVILGVVSAIAYSRFVSTGDEVASYTDNVEEAAIANEIEATFVKLRMFAREFTVTGRKADAKKVERLVNELPPLFAKADTRFTESKRKEKVAAVQQAVGTYFEDFKKAKKLQGDLKRRVTEELEPTGDKFLADLDILLKQAVLEGNSDARNYVEQAVRHALLARLYANVTLGRHDASFGTRTKSEFDKLTTAVTSINKVAQTQEERKLAGDLIKLLHHYEQSFTNSEQDEKAIQNLVKGEMATAAGATATDTEWIKKEASQVEKQIRKETVAGIKSAEFAMLITSIVGIMIGIVIGWFIGNGISKPVISMTGAMSVLAEGNLDAEIPAQGRTDEIGKMAAAVQIFKDNAIRVKRLEEEAKDQERKAAEETTRLMNQLADDFQASVGGVVETVSSASTELQASAQSMTVISEETSSRATTVAAASEEASTNVQTVASAAEELSSSISEINRQVQQSTKTAGAAVEAAGKADAMVQDLAVSAQKISEVVELITDIADQTNLLALNATIEAARAGEAGKGFAVVAGEVKNLANQTARATQEIGGQISGIQAATEGSVRAIHDITRTIGEINEIASSIAAAVEEQGAATQEIAHNVEQAAAGTGEVSSNIQDVTQAATEAGSTSSQVLSAANELSEQSELLKMEMDKFMYQVRKS